MITNTFKYSLETGSKKFECPQCHQKTMVRYIDNETREHLPGDIGRCDRENKCGYHSKPNFQNQEKHFIVPTKIEPPKPIDFIPLDFVKKSIASYVHSHFDTYIINLFGEQIGSDLLLKYMVGRSKNSNGKATIFWRIDINENVRTGKIMTYDPHTGKRIKEIPTGWVHTTFKPFNFELCFFGEHLITEFPDKTIAICESEKTAIISSFFMPQYNWIATGGASGCKWREYNVFKVLKNKNVLLFPDFGYYNKKSLKTCYQEWNDRANAIMDRMHCNIKVSKVLEDHLPESNRVDDIDLVDVLVKRDELTGIALTDEGYPVMWDYKLA